MNTSRWLALAIAVVFFLFPALAGAQGTHEHGSGGGGMKMDTREVLVEGLKLTFMIMANEEHRTMLKDMKMKDDIMPGTTHNITVVVTDQATQKEVTDAALTMKVVAPGGGDQIRPLKYESSMKSYDGYFNMPETGRYELLVLIKAGGLKRAAGVFYDLK